MKATSITVELVANTTDFDTAIERIIEIIGLPEEAESTEETDGQESN